MIKLINKILNILNLITYKIKKSIVTNRGFLFQLNHASAFIDSSQLYGHNDAKASFIRTNEGGKLKTEEIDGQEFPFQERRFGSQSCDGRENVKVCFDGGAFFKQPYLWFKWKLFIFNLQVILGEINTSVL